MFFCLIVDCHIFLCCTAKDLSCRQRQEEQLMFATKVQYNKENEFPDSSYEMIKPLPFVSPSLLDDAKAWLAGECSTPRSMVVAEAFPASPWCYHILMTG